MTDLSVVFDLRNQDVLHAALPLNPSLVAVQVATGVDWSAVVARLDQEHPDRSGRILAVQAAEGNELWSRRQRKRVAESRLDVRVTGAPVLWRAPEWNALGETLVREGLLHSSAKVEAARRKDGSLCPVVRLTLTTAADVSALVAASPLLVEDAIGQDHEVAFEALRDGYKWLLPPDTGWAVVSSWQ